MVISLIVTVTALTQIHFKISEVRYSHKDSSLLMIGIPGASVLAPFPENLLAIAYVILARCIDWSRPEKLDYAAVSYPIAPSCVRVLKPEKYAGSWEFTVNLECFYLELEQSHVL